MMYEYKVVELQEAGGARNHNKILLEPLQSAIDEMAADGWRLVQTMNTVSTVDRPWVYGCHFLIFEREK